MDLVKVLRNAGLTVDTRYFRRPAPGDFTPVGVMYHHTVTGDTEGALKLLRDGRSDLPGPLCQVGIRKNGVCVVLTNGRANHAGKGSQTVLNEVRANKAVSGDAGKRGLTDSVNGNGFFYGFEMLNMGDGRDPYPQAQIDAMLRAGAAIIKAAGWNNQNRAIHHREWTRRKIDMSWRGDLRGGVGRFLTTTPTPPPTPKRRYTMVIYAKRGTVDALAALAAHAASPVGVVTQSLTEAKAALDRGERVVAVGGPAATDLPNATVVIRGSSATDTAVKVTQFAHNGWK